MKDFLLKALGFVGLVLALSAVGLSIEWYRRRDLRKFAQEQGGTFEPGGLIASVDVPEAAEFDLHGDTATHHNVTRIVRPEATYILAQFQTSYKDIKSTPQSYSCVMGYVVLKGELPQIRVNPRTGGHVLGALLGMPEPPPPLKVPNALPAFDENWVVHARQGVKDIPPDFLAGFLSKSVQEELVARKDLITGLYVRGNVVRLQAISQQTGYPHRDVFAVAQKLGAIWGGR